jgi:hypothetical protein
LARIELGSFSLTSLRFAPAQRAGSTEVYHISRFDWFFQTLIITQPILMFQASITLAVAHGSIGGSILSDVLTVACKIPRNRSIAQNLNSPRFEPRGLRFAIYSQQSQGVVACGDKMALNQETSCD